MLLNNIPTRLTPMRGIFFLLNLDMISEPFPTGTHVLAYKLIAVII